MHQLLPQYTSGAGDTGTGDHKTDSGTQTKHMTTFLYTTTSTGGKPTHPDDAQTIIDTYSFPDEFTIEVTTNYIDIRAVDAYNSFDAYDPDTNAIVTEEFLAALQPHLAEQLVIKCIETQGYGGATAYKWIVGPDTNPVLHNF